MSFAEQHLDFLVALRTISFPTYLNLMRDCHSPESYQSAIDLVAAAARDEAAEGTDDLSGLTRLLASPGYRDFLAQVTVLAPEHVPVIQQLLETREYTQRLAATKKSSVQEYLDELRVVSAEEIIRALQDGTVVNALDEHGRPLPIRSDEEVSGAFAETPTATAYVDAEVLQNVIADFATGRDGKVANPQGLRLREVVIGGPLNLNWMQLDFALGFEGCDFYHWISANHLSVPWLSFDSCDFTPRGQRFHSDSGAFNASAIKVSSSLRFWDCRGLGQLFVPDAEIGDFSPADLQPPTDDSDADSRIVIDGARFGRLWLTSDGSGLPIQVGRSVRIRNIKLGGVEDSQDRKADRAAAQRVHDWLTASTTKLPEDVWHEFEQALRRSGMSRIATEFGVMGARTRTRARRWGWFERLLLDRTVRYFYGNLTALWWLLGLFMITFGLAFAFARDFVQSPLANPSTLPEGWWDPVLDRTLWALLYASDTVLSPISLGQADTVWPEASWLTFVLAAVKGLSLLLLGLLIVGVTGLAEKRGTSVGSDS